MMSLWPGHLLSNSQNAEPPYHIHTFDVLPAVHMEQLGEVRLYHSTWTLLAYVDLNDLEVHELHLFQGARFLLKECGKCLQKTSIQSLQHQLNMAKDSRERLFSLIGYRSANVRRRRGLLDPVGEICKILFGTMSASDSLYYNNEIDLIHSDNKRNAELFKNQTRIVKVSLEKTNQMLIDYKNKLEIIQDNFKTLEKQENDIIKTREIISHSFELEVSVVEYIRTLDLLNQAVINARRGEISPQLIEPALFKDVLLQIKLKEGSDRMPIDVDDSNYFEYLIISEISIASINNRLMYHIQIPIMEKDFFKATKLITIPGCNSTASCRLFVIICAASNRWH
ncbi:hypothetical protein KPH14_012888 [Odynerus spinipes]|uniref:Uncharacterized protein n=1 Tax=Odynerus spinipes TaxID=1348599 RepID=A0AAD9RDT7_9HYME|nr:hypothetical protein KPH14_012888 [Odynerus spinipes]